MLFEGSEYGHSLYIRYGDKDPIRKDHVVVDCFTIDNGKSDGRQSFNPFICYIEVDGVEILNLFSSEDSISELINFLDERNATLVWNGIDINLNDEVQRR